MLGREVKVCIRKVAQVVMISSEPPVEEEPILSPELIAELGGEEGADVVLTGKKKKRKHNPDEVSEEVKTLAKQLSKKAQKRIAQITQRKEKEAKRSDFLSTIHEHEISEEHRQLLTSSRGINQTLTMKQLLSSIYKKQAAGLTLTPEESQLLYNQPNEGKVVASSTFPVLTTTAAPDVIDTTLANAASNAEEGFLSFDDIIPLNSGSVEANPWQNKPKKVKRKKNKGSAQDEDEQIATIGLESKLVEVATGTNEKSAPAPTAAVSPTAGSVGFNLLAQLKKLKEGSAPAPKRVHIGSTSIANAAEEENSAGAGATGGYEVREIACPVSSQGEVLVRNTPAAPAAGTDTAGANVGGDTSGANTSSIRAKGKSGSTTATVGDALTTVTAGSKAATAVGVNRSAEVQAARMELPVCHMEQEVGTFLYCIVLLGAFVG